MNDITYGSIVPLIGGENLGIMKSLEGQLPEWVLSYTDFAKNDAHFINHLKEKDWKGEYVFLNEEGNEGYKAKTVDVVNTVCPCAGLSSLSVSSSADSAVNEWMYTTSEYVLSEIKPKVFWGENAPRLYTKAGEKVANRLYEIGKQHGYSLNLYYTESRLHGLAQKRPRTFYFFTKGTDSAPLFRYIRRPLENIEDILKADISPDDPMNRLINSDNPMDNPWVAYCVHKSGSKTLAEYYEKIEKTTNCIVSSDNISDNLNEVADWMEQQGFDQKFADRARAMQEKVDGGKGYWAHGVTMPKGEIPSLIGAMPHSLINPFKEQFLTLRDALRIMKMPDDFNMIGDNPQSPGNANAICQNVPVTTAADMMDFVVEYLKGMTDTVSSDYVRQNNSTMKHEIVNEDLVELDQFFV